MGLFDGYGPDNPLVMSGAGLCKYARPDALKKLTDAADLTVLGSITPGDIRGGNPGDSKEYYDNPLYSVNAWGMNNDGSNMVEATREDVPAELRAKLIVSLAAFSIDGYADLFTQLCGWGAGVELNFGCPNVRDDGRQEPIASFNSPYLDEILQVISVRVGENPIFVGVKLSPYTDPGQLAEVAAIINAAGFVDYVAVTNTIPNCRVYTPEHKPGIRVGPDNNINLGGAGGEALKPLSLMNAEAFRDKLDDRIAVVRVGGISSGEDIWQSHDVGCAGVQMVTAVANHGTQIFTKTRQQYADIVG